jgi:hypothetical protein
VRGSIPRDRATITTRLRMLMETMTTAQMQEQYEVLGFAYYMCVVKRKSDGVKGTLDFDHSPRVYYNFQPA